jgi:hypothetical protein
MNLVVRVGGQREDYIDLASQSRIDISQFFCLQYAASAFESPRAPTAWWPVARQGPLPGSLKPAMTRDDMAFGISKNWVGEAECFDGYPHLIDLSLRMGARIADQEWDRHRPLSDGNAAKVLFMAEPAKKTDRTVTPIPIQARAAGF